MVKQTTRLLSGLWPQQARIPGAARAIWLPNVPSRAKRALVSLLAVTLLGMAAAEPLGVVSPHLALGFEPTQGGLVHFIDASTRRDLIQSNLAAGPLWEIEFPTATGRKPITSQDAKVFRLAPLPGGQTGWRLVWQRFDSAQELERVEATVLLDRDGPGSRWGLRLSGLNQGPPHRVHFPKLHHLSQAAGERLAIPEWLGQEHADPRGLLHDSKGGGKRLEFAYPGLLSLQCAAFYPTQGAGLYLACNDVTAYVKRVAFFGEAGGSLGCEWVHYPEADAVKRGAWVLPYQVVLGTFEGDWLTAAERYRGWATNQPWARSSRLAQGQVPAWVLNTGLWVWNRGRSPAVLAPASRLRQEAGLPVSVFWHWWHGCAYDSGFPEYLPPREGAAPFQSALEEAHGQGLHALVYMNQRLWGMTTESWGTKAAERYAVKGLNGKVQPESYNTFTNTPCASMCMGTGFWRDHYGGLAETAINQLGVDGIYMDQACTSLACYDPAHGHPLGGGTYWIGGFRLLAADIRQRARFPLAGAEPTRGAARLLARPRQPALAGEGCGEAWLPYLDLMLSLQVSKERYAGPDGWEPIPFFQAVYHPYAVSYGNYSSLTMPPYDDLWPAASAPAEPLKLLDRKFSRQFYREQARAFVWGQQPTIANFQSEQLRERAEEIDYVIRLARLRARAAKYLLYGTFLRPPTLNAPEASIDLSRLSIYAGQQGGLKTFEWRVSLALAGAWRAPDGDQALVLASLSEQSMVLNLTLPAEFAMLPGNTRVYRLDDRARPRPRNAGPVRSVSRAAAARGLHP